MVLSHKEQHDERRLIDKTTLSQVSNNPINEVM